MERLLIPTTVLTALLVDTITEGCVKMKADIKDPQKTYFTAFQAIMDSPEAKTCRRAGKKLFDKLANELGSDCVESMKLTLNSNATGPAIRISVKGFSSLSRVPKEFSGFEVLAVATSDISA